jgi:hypothetical protein
MTAIDRDIFFSGVGSTPSLPKFFLLIVSGDAESVPLKKAPIFKYIIAINPPSSKKWRKIMFKA